MRHRIRLYVGHAIPITMMFVFFYLCYEFMILTVLLYINIKVFNFKEVVIDYFLAKHYIVSA